MKRERELPSAGSLTKYRQLGQADAGKTPCPGRQLKLLESLSAVFPDAKARSWIGSRAEPGCLTGHANFPRGTLMYHTKMPIPPNLILI